jgi:hypothetical protein
VVAYWAALRAHQQEVANAEIETVLTGLSHKTGSARALTLNGLLTVGEADLGLREKLRPVLIASWGELPAEVQQQLLQYR